MPHGVFEKIIAIAARLCDTHDVRILQVEGNELRTRAHHGTVSLEAAVNEFSVLPAAEQRKWLQAFYRVLTPKGFAPRYAPADKRHDAVYAAWELEVLHNAQSIGFTAEIIPLMLPYLERMPTTHEYELLDVGCRTGAGSALLTQIFTSHFTHCRLAVDTIDIDPMFAGYQIARWPYLRNVIVGDAFGIADKSYDLVLCSHTLEHIDDPVPFVRKLRSVARHFCFVYCPYNEVNPIPGHNRITPEFIASQNPIETKVLKSWWWRKGEDHASQDAVFFVLAA